jgi:uncharacterized NAD(P)/FAD-binding protein YdhS
VTKTDIAVLGAGFSATAVVINLLEHLSPEKQISVIGSQSGFGRGVAYSTSDENHRLNVAAGRMSLFADRPNDLVEWLDRRQSGHGPEDFIPRQLFGAYIADTLSHGLQRTGNRARVQFVDAQALVCHALSSEQQVFELTNADVVDASRTVFCLGGTPAGLPVAPSRIEDAARPLIIDNPWAEAWLDKIDPDAPLFIVGSGLTMIDQVVSLHRRSHRGRIHVLSRHGLIPHPHVVPRAPAIDPGLVPGRTPLSEMQRMLRKAAGEASDWRSVIDGLRPITQALWQHMDIEERRRFLRHAASWWNIHRHRMSPEIAAVLNAMQASGQLVMHKGWIDRVSADSDCQASVTFLQRHSRLERRIAISRIINCTGMEKCSIGKLPLLRDMLQKGFIAQDSLGLGVAVDAHSRILPATGAASGTGSYAIGPMTVGQFWEIFAVPDIRVQARDVAQRIAAAA